MAKNLPPPEKFQSTGHAGVDAKMQELHDAMMATHKEGCANCVEGDMMKQMPTSMKMNRPGY